MHHFVAGVPLLQQCTVAAAVYRCCSSVPGVIKLCYTFIFLFHKVSKITIYKNTKADGSLHTFIRIITIILFNETSFSSNDTAQTRSGTLANFADENLFS